MSAASPDALPFAEPANSMSTRGGVHSAFADALALQLPSQFASALHCALSSPPLQEIGFASPVHLPSHFTVAPAFASHFALHLPLHWPLHCTFGAVALAVQVPLHVPWHEPSAWTHFPLAKPPAAH